MTELLSTCTVYKSVNGDTKTLILVTPATAESNDTIDLNSDSASSNIRTILNTLVQDDAGADKDATWDPDTGIITLGTLVTGIHNVLVEGI